MKYCDFDSGLYRTYQKGRELAPDVLNMWMAEVASLVAPSEVDRVLDLGAGTGRFSLPLSRVLGAEVVAVDLASRMLAQVDPTVPRLVARAEALPFADDSYDVVFASMVVHHLEDLEVAALEVRRVLRERGSFLVRTCFSENLSTPYHRFFPGVLEIELEVLPSTDDVVTAFGRAGLRHIETRKLRQRQDDDYRAYADRLRMRAMSPLRLISDREFADGMAALDEFAESRTGQAGVFEEIELVHFGLEPLSGVAF